MRYSLGMSIQGRLGMDRSEVAGVGCWDMQIAAAEVEPGGKSVTWCSLDFMPRLTAGQNQLICAQLSLSSSSTSLGGELCLH